LESWAGGIGSIRRCERWPQVVKSRTAESSQQGFDDFILLIILFLPVLRPDGTCCYVVARGLPVLRPDGTCRFVVCSLKFESKACLAPKTGVYLCKWPIFVSTSLNNRSLSEVEMNAAIGL
jgi:hypothetical protein